MCEKDNSVCLKAVVTRKLLCQQLLFFHTSPSLLRTNASAVSRQLEPRTTACHGGQNRRNKGQKKIVFMRKFKINQMQFVFRLFCVLI